MNSTFRANVGAVIADQAGRVLIFERADGTGGWQFPQGGIDEGEEPEAAVRREITEETGLDPSNMTHLATHPEWLAYELPIPARRPKTGRGQAQKWFLFRLTGVASPQLPQGPDPEFSGYRWVDIDEAVARVVDFKRPVYTAVAEYFRPLLVPSPGKLTAEGREYLLAELAHVSASYISNEEAGERRVVSFVTFIALLATAVGLAAENLPQAGDVETLWLAFAALLASLAVGVLTFRRLLKRNVDTTRMLNRAHDIRVALTGGDPVAREVIPFGRPGPRAFRWRNGGLAETVTVLNSLLVAAAVALIATDGQIPGVITAFAAALGFVVAAGAHWSFGTAYYKRGR